MSRKTKFRAAFRPIAVVLACTVAGSVSAKDKPRRHTEDQRQPTGCEYIGKGYVKAAGTDTCVKVSGSSRTEGAVFFGH